MTALIVALGAVVALLAVLVVGLLRSHAEILRALHDLGVNLEDGPDGAARRGVPRTVDGVPSPRAGGPREGGVDLTGALPRGGAARVAVVGVEHRTLLAFLTSGCGTCGVFWEDLGAGAAADLSATGPETRVVVVTQGPEAESPAGVAELAPADLVTVMTTEAWDSYDVPVAPYFVLVDGPTGRVLGEGAGTSWSQVVDLLGKAEADAGHLRGAGRRPERMSGRDRADRVDRELHAAGIEPGDPSLYPSAESKP